MELPQYSLSGIILKFSSKFYPKNQIEKLEKIIEYILFGIKSFPKLFYKANSFDVNNE